MSSFDVSKIVAERLKSTSTGILAIVITHIVLAGCNTLPVTSSVPIASLTHTFYPVKAVTPFECSSSVVSQPFEHGWIFWVGQTLMERCHVQHAFVPNTGAIWVAFTADNMSGGKWLIFMDSWDAAYEPELNVALVPPDGLLQPARGFGKVWRELLSATDRDAIGWATGLEAIHGAVYRYEKGEPVIGQTNVLAPGNHTLILDDGETFVFIERSQSVTHVSSP